jgi:predicted ATPase/DNA-binding CsgD family transcriptional regulator
VELSSFIGRRRELAEVKRLLGESRLVTLTGVGGVGKTRLAQRVADQGRRAFADGVWFVDLTAVRDPALLVQHVEDPQMLAHLVALDLGLRQQSTQPPLELLTDYIAARSVLLVLDNCEHLIPACAVLADGLLVSCPGLRILATSREPLGIAGEALFAVPPLAVPGHGPVPGRGPGGSELLGYESVALFVARSQTALPGFRLGQDNQAAVTGICRRLDGLPLAIELAASWLPVLAPRQILDRLDDRFRLLSRGTRSAPQRQQTLRACMDWSFELCSKPERLLWARASVFVGGCELDAIEGVCTDDRLPEAELLDVLAGLVEKSVLIRDDDGRVTRYRMLETLKDYGRERLMDSGEDSELRRRHRDWYQHLVEQATAEWVSDRQVHWYSLLGRAHSDLRAAVEFCLTEPGEAEAALRITVSLPAMYWRGRGLFGDGRRWLDRGLAHATSPTGLRARALILASELAFIQGDTETGTRLIEQGAQLAEQLHDSASLATAAYTRGLSAMYSNELPSAVQMLERGLELMSSSPDREPGLRPQLLSTLGRAAGLAGDHDRAIACAREVLALTEPVGEFFWRSHAMRLCANVAWREGKLQEASQYARKCLQLSQEIDDRFSIALGLEEMAWISADQRRHQRAATLLGSANMLFTDLAAPITSYQHMVGFHRRCEQDTRAALGDATFHDAFTHGRNLTYEAALAFAREEPTPPTSTPSVATPLTPRERQVAGLISEGLSNKEIAARLVISQRTAETHVENILTKLGFTSRTQVAAWVTVGPGAAGAVSRS